MSEQLGTNMLSAKKRMENSLRMRSMAYLAQVKANLLTETIFEVESDKRHIQKELAYKDEMILAQSRHAAMGEIISMIAHQWRQPLSIISMDANNMLLDIELDSIDKDVFKEGIEDVIGQTKYLSKTIDDFRGFFRPDKMIQTIYIQDIIDDTLKIINSSLVNVDIKVTVNAQEDQKIETYAREIQQVLINLLNNAKDALVQSDVKDKKIVINGKLHDGRVSLSICDNGGGVDEKIISKIFEPYFTTKDKKNGTGLGLYMSKNIVEKHLLGSLSVENTDDGACFKIALPLTLLGRGDLQ